MPQPSRVSLTTFVDFVSKSGTPKITVVRAFKNGDVYQPAFDFYRAIREAIVALHKDGKDKKALDSVLAGLDPKKVGAYVDIIKGHKKFMGKKQFGWFEPPDGAWSEGGITVQVNPELGLEIGDTRHVVKLYFKAEQLAKKNLAVLARVMETGLPAPEPPPLYSILDVRRGVLHTPNTGIAGLDALLRGEALNFASILAGV